jgi:hypothetical protein
MFKLFLEASGEDSGRNASLSASRFGRGSRCLSRYPNSERERALGRDVIDGGPWRGR